MNIDAQTNLAPARGAPGLSHFFAALVLEACAARPHTQHTQTTANLHTTIATRDAGAVLATDAEATEGLRQNAPVPLADGPAQVRASASALEPMAADDALWNSFRVLSVILQATHQLAAPTAPMLEHDIGSISMLLQPTASVASQAERESVCVQLTQSEPRIACNTEAVEMFGAIRARWNFAWRITGPSPSLDVGVALRALSRLRDKLCVQKIELAANTLELTVRSADRAQMGESLALLTSAPRMSDATVVRFEPTAAGVVATLSWPLDRVNREQASLASDAWPMGCDGRVSVLPDDATLLRATQFVRGTVAQGVVLERAARRFFLTVGDRIGDSEIIAIAPQSVRVRIRSPGSAAGRERVLSITAPTRTDASDPSRTRRTLLPPEPALPPPPRFGNAPRAP